MINESCSEHVYKDCCEVSNVSVILCGLISAFDCYSCIASSSPGPLSQCCMQKNFSVCNIEKLGMVLETRLLAHTF